MRCEIADEVGPVGFDGVEQRGFVEAIAGFDVGLAFDEYLDGWQIADARGVDERRAAKFVPGVNVSAVLEKATDAFALAVGQRLSGGMKQGEEWRKAIGVAAIDIRAVGNCGAKRTEISGLGRVK